MLEPLNSLSISKLNLTWAVNRSFYVYEIITRCRSTFKWTFMTIAKWEMAEEMLVEFEIYSRMLNLCFRGAFFASDLKMWNWSSASEIRKWFNWHRTPRTSQNLQILMFITKHRSCKFWPDFYSWDLPPLSYLLPPMREHNHHRN